MDPKKNITSILDTVEKSLATASFRNAYEAHNTHASNIERLDSAVSVLKSVQLSAAEIDVIQRRIASLRSLNEDVVKRAVGPAKVVSAADEWLKQLEENANEEDEEALIEQLAAKKKKEKKEKKEKKDKKEKDREAKVVERLPAAPAPRERNEEEEEEERRKRLAEESAMQDAKVLFAAPNCGFAGLPLAALEGKCVVRQIPNTPCVELRYETPAEVPTTPDPSTEGKKGAGKANKKKKDDDNNCVGGASTAADHHSVQKGNVVAVMYRVVVAALWKGVPTTSSAVVSSNSNSSSAHQNTTTHNTGGGAESKKEWKYGGEEEEDGAAALEGEAEEGVVSSDKKGEEGLGADDVGAVEPKQGENAEEEDDEEEEHIIEHNGEEGDEEILVDNTLREASEKLVQEYKEAEAEDDADQFSRGRDAPSQILIPTTHFRRAYEAPWTVLICHGGYFAGGVFINGKAVVHKAFQRYVVRKGQGGLQSKADKTGGIAKSVGSQIRRQNELKWKVMVRDILLNWKAHIDASWVILYVAPGPENRNILTDFSSIPASFGGGSGKGAAKSPIDMKDIRVRSAPLTTHRPTFAEVQRIYHEVSRVTVRYEEPVAMPSTSTK